MKLSIDTDKRTLALDSGEVLDLYSPAAFEEISRHWLRVGWAQKYSYTFTWLGRPIIQLPEDLIRVQEAVFSIQPDLIVETGVAHGGSLVFYASLCKLLDRGRVIGIDVMIRENNRREIEKHPLAKLITLIEGSSTDVRTVARVREQIRSGEVVMVLLDSNHSRQHVYEELQAYSPFVSVGSFIVATDGIMKDLADVPGGKTEWASDNPVAAVQQFLKDRNDFELVEPAWKFNESPLKRSITHWPSAWLRRIR